MKQAEKPESRGTDKVLLVIVFLLVIIGLIILYSTSSYNGQIKFGDPFYYLKKQIFATSLGLAGMYAVARTDYHIWEKLAVPGYLMAIVLCIAVMLFGDEYNGSKRWLSLGPFSFQPSEYVKVALIVFLAWPWLCSDFSVRSVFIWVDICCIFFMEKRNRGSRFGNEQGKEI